MQTEILHKKLIVCFLFIYFCFYITLGLSPSFLSTPMKVPKMYKYLVMYVCMDLSVKTVLKTATKMAGMFLENRSDSVHKYGYVVLRVRYLPRVLLIEAMPCLCKPLKLLQMSRTRKLN